MFTKIDPQYRTPGVAFCRRLEKLAAKYGARLVLSPCWGAGSYYGEIYPPNDDNFIDAVILDVRVSRHAPNPHNGSSDIYVYASEWLGAAEQFCVDLELLWSCQRPDAVRAYLSAQRKKFVAAKAAKEAALRQAELAAAKASLAARNKYLTARCRACGITAERIRAAYAAENPDPCGIDFQIRKWFKGLNVEAAVQFAADAE
ncbi:MAG TPA: hypothetical protein VLH56_11900 [Dissulfurispiraceae bacterium]|nr:hypothetical protein [Dissulfurispiraceae bacterium]